jgi:phosphatidylglycerol---prolipoprotein diacylglyceryl transferase
MLPMLAITFPQISPVAIQFGEFAIRWYALSYIAGIFLAYFMLGKMWAKHPRNLPLEMKEDIISYSVLGILLGGRLGFVLFYGNGHFLSNPLEIFYVWRGGMSFHGGFLGSLAAIYLMCRKHKVKFFDLSDMLACVTPIGLLLGRIANFVNAELYGRVTDVPWAVIFPDSPYPRHPSQLYEAALEGLVLLIILQLLFWKTQKIKKSGFLSGVFLAGYSIARIIVENFREPDVDIGFIFENFTMGQILSLPMLIFGMFLMLRNEQNNTRIAER